MKRTAMVVADVGAGGIQLYGTLAIGQGFLEPFHLPQNETAHLERQGVIPQQLQAFVEERKGFLEASQSVKNISCLARCMAIPRIERQRMLETEKGVLRTASLDEGIAHLPPKHRVAGRQ